MKQKYIKKTLFFTGVFIFVSIVFFVQIIPISAQTEPISSTTTPSPISLMPDMPKTPNNELEVLNAKVNIISEYNDRMIKTVQWSLGFVASILVVYLGLNLYSTNKQLKADFESLEKTITLNITSENKNLKNQLDKTINDQIMKYKDEIESSIKDQIKQLAGIITILEISTKVNEARIWEIKEVWKNAIDVYTNIINLDSNSPYINTSLSGLEKAIENYDKKLLVWDIEEIEGALKNLGESHQTTSTRIKELIQKNISSHE